MAIENHYDQACFAFARGHNRLRAVLAEIKEAMAIKTGEPLTEPQKVKLSNYRVRLYLNALAADLLGPDAEAPTSASLAQAQTILEHKGFSKLAKEGEARRTEVQERTLVRMRQAWSVLTRDLGIPAIDNRGGAVNPIGVTNASPEVQEKAAINAMAKIEKVHHNIIQLLPPPKRSVEDFSRDLAILMEKFIVENDVTSGTYARAMKAFIKKVTQEPHLNERHSA